MLHTEIIITKIYRIRLKFRETSLRIGYHYGYSYFWRCLISILNKHKTTKEICELSLKVSLNKLIEIVIIIINKILTVNSFGNND